MGSPGQSPSSKFNDLLISSSVNKKEKRVPCTPNPYLNPLDDISLKSGAIGIVVGTSLTLLPYLNRNQYFLTIYFTTCSIFYFMEFFTTARYNPENVTKDSFLLDDNELLASHLVAILEHLVETYIFKFAFKINLVLTLNILGLLLIMFGQFLRSSAMITANRSFNHYVQHTKSKEHLLVTHGIYKFSRHPSYAGFFWWIVGLQIMLLNPICLIVFSIVIFRFFKSRILDEEIYLVKFFGQDYLTYRHSTKTLIPFLK